MTRSRITRQTDDGPAPREFFLRRDARIVIAIADS